MINGYCQIFELLSGEIFPVLIFSQGFSFVIKQFSFERFHPVRKHTYKFTTKSTKGIGSIELVWIVRHLSPFENTSIGIKNDSCGKHSSIIKICLIEVSFASTNNLSSCRFSFLLEIPNFESYTVFCASYFRFCSRYIYGFCIVVSTLSVS